MARVFLPLLAAALLPTYVRGSPDSTQPCHYGQCRWDYSEDANTFGTIRLSGSQSSISDLTEAAGWLILDCDSSAASQDIRAVCADPTRGCDHLYLNGAQNTFVRLPDECGSMPFALVKAEWTHENQAIPSSKRSRLNYNSGQTYTVRGMSLSTSFADADPTQHGNVSLDALGSSGYRTPNDLDNTDLDLLGLTITKDVNSTAPLAGSGSASLYNRTLSCPQSGSVPAYSGEFNIEAEGSINGTMAYAFQLHADFFGEISVSMNATVDLNATIAASLDLNTTLTGSLSSGRIQIATIGIPGFSWGVLAIGPMLTLYAEADALLNANIDLGVGIAFTLSDVQLAFPSSSSTLGQFNADESSIQISTDPTVTTEGQISAHLIPSIEFGVNIAEGRWKSTIGVDIDASTTFSVNVTAEEKASMSSDGSNSTDFSWLGCIDLSSGLTLEASADADLLFYSKGTIVPLYNSSYDLYQQCWPKQNSNRRRAHIDLGDDSMASSYPQRVLKKYAGQSFAAASTNATSSSFGCGSQGSSGVSPIIKTQIPRPTR